MLCCIYPLLHWIYSVSSFALVPVGLSFSFLVTLGKCFVRGASNSCFIRCYLIVFTKKHFVIFRPFPEKKDFIVFQTFWVTLILIMSNFQKYSLLVLRRRFIGVLFSFLQLLQFQSFIFQNRFFILECYTQSFTHLRIFIGS